MGNREYTKAELEAFLAFSKVLAEKAESQIKELDMEVSEDKAKEVEEYVIELPEQGLYLHQEGTVLEEYTLDALETEGWNINILNKLGDIRTNPDSAWVSARRNIRANRLEALAHSIGGAYEFEFGVDNWYAVVDAKGQWGEGRTSAVLEPEKIYMTRDTAEKVCEILNSGRYKLNVDVAVEEDLGECPCCACQAKDY